MHHRVTYQNLISHAASFGSSCCSRQRNTGNVTLYNVACSSQSTALARDCSFNVISGYSTSDGCNLQRDLIVGCYEPSSCTEGDVRLVNGNSSLEGRVEVCSQGLWGAITNRYWDENGAVVVCKQLGYPWECELLR